MNSENLTRKSPSEARKNGSKGGIASGKKRRQNRSMREVFQQIKNLPVNDSKLKAQLKAVGIEDEDTTYAASMAWSTIYHAMKGNSQMMRLAFEMMGEDPSTVVKEREIKLKEKLAEGGTVGEPTIIIMPPKDGEKNPVNCTPEKDTAK